MGKPIEKLFCLAVAMAVSCASDAALAQTSPVPPPSGQSGSPSGGRAGLTDGASRCRTPADDVEITQAKATLGRLYEQRSKLNTALAADTQRAEKLQQNQSDIKEEQSRLVRLEALNPCAETRTIAVPPTLPPEGPSRTVPPDRCKTPADDAKIAEVSRELAAAESRVKVYADDLRHATDRLKEARNAAAASSEEIRVDNQLVAEDTRKLGDAKARRDKLQQELDTIKALKPCSETRKAAVAPTPSGTGGSSGTVPHTPERKKADTLPPAPGGPEDRIGMNAPAEASWYFCRDTQLYYPQVATCNSGWVPVPMQTQPTTTEQPPTTAGQSAPTRYYCDNPQGYYPTVATCSTAWRPMPADPQRP